MEVYEAMRTRRSVRKFKPDPVPQEVLDRIINAGLYAASGMGAQDAVIVQISDRTLRDALSRKNGEVMGAPEGFDPFYGAPEVLIVLARKAHPTHVYDGSLVMGNLMLAAHAEGLGSCWIHRAKEEFDAPWGMDFLKKLGLTEEYEGIGHCVLGYPEGDVPAAAPRKENRVFRV